MIPTGTKIKFKLPDGTKGRGVITNVEAHTETIEITQGPESGDPDLYRKFVPGRTAITLTIDVDPASVKP